MLNKAIRLECFVIVGYPQKTGKVEANLDIGRKTQKVEAIDQHNYNSICCVDPKGRLIHTYQKAFLYETDENWAAEGPGFVSTHIHGLGKVNIAHNSFLSISAMLMP